MSIFVIYFDRHIFEQLTIIVYAKTSKSIDVAVILIDLQFKKSGVLLLNLLTTYINAMTRFPSLHGATSGIHHAPSSDRIENSAVHAKYCIQKPRMRII